jgi:hypothetical protein
MDFKKIVIALLMFCLGQGIAWVQVYGYLKWNWFKNNDIMIYVLSLPIAYFIVTGTRLCIEGLDGKTWPVRILTFTIGFLIFGLMSFLVLKQVPDTKTCISIVLCLVIIVIQFL